MAHLEVDIQNDGLSSELHSNSILGPTVFDNMENLSYIPYYWGKLR